MAQQKVWKHKSTFILAAAGAAIGLGNIWKFPYMVGDNGGGAFVLIYLLCIALISLPLMIAETVVGRHAQRNPFDAIKLVAKQSNASGAWSALAVIGMLSLFFIFSFFSVVGGWSFAYAVETFSNEFHGMTPDQVGQAFAGFLSEPNRLIMWHTIFAVATGLIVILGIIDGIEKGLRWLMPILLVLIIFMLGYCIFFFRRCLVLLVLFTLFFHVSLLLLFPHSPPSASSPPATASPFSVADFLPSSFWACCGWRSLPLYIFF